MLRSDRFMLQNHHQKLPIATSVNDSGNRIHCVQVVCSTTTIIVTSLLPGGSCSFYSDQYSFFCAKKVEGGEWKGAGSLVLYNCSNESFDEMYYVCAPP